MQPQRASVASTQYAAHQPALLPFIVSSPQSTDTHTHTQYSEFEPRDSRDVVSCKPKHAGPGISFAASPLLLTMLPSLLPPNPRPMSSRSRSHQPHRICSYFRHDLQTSKPGLPRFRQA
ncbi:hypothetical protein CSPX01_11737 [Colletotrichum filicis]|nr:hypothetical protein CSPX01_11737 [Colletotrichum filicis]